MYEVAEIDLRLFVKHPHDFCRIHYRTAAKGDDGVRRETFHDFGTAAHGRYIRVGFDVGKDGIDDFIAAQVQLFDDALEEAEFDHCLIGDNHRLVDVFHFLQVLHRIAFEIDFGRYFEPLHIVSPAADFFDVEQVDGADVIADGIVSVGAAAEGERGQEGVIDVADAAKGGGRIPDNADGFHRLAELFDQFRIFAVNGGGMAEAVKFHHLPRFFNPVGVVFRFQYGDDRGKFFAGEWFFFAYFFYFGGKDIGIGRHGKSRLRGNPDCRATNNIGIEFAKRAIFAVGFHAEAKFFQLRLFFFINEIDFVGFEFIDEGVINFLVDNDRLLRGADHAVIKRFAHHNIVRRLADVGGFLHIGGDVARAATEALATM